MNDMKITYTDGHVDEVRTQSPAVLTRTEEHAQLAGWKPGEASKIRMTFYAVYIAVRLKQLTELKYDEWLDTVDNVAPLKHEEAEPGNPTV